MFHIKCLQANFSDLLCKKLTACLSWLHFQESLAGILEKLGAIKSKHQLLCSELVTVGLAQKDTINSISVNLANTMDLIQQFHHTTDVEVPPVFLNIVELLLYIKGKDSHHFSQNAICSQCALEMNGFLFFNKKDGKVHLV